MERSWYVGYSKRAHFGTNCYGYVGQYLNNEAYQSTVERAFIFPPTPRGLPHHLFSCDTGVYLEWKHAIDQDAQGPAEIVVWWTSIPSDAPRCPTLPILAYK